jgi:hypothetical protein
MKILNGIRFPEVLEEKDKRYYIYQERMNDIIHDSGILLSNTKYDYFKVKDLLAYLNDNKKVYEEFKGFNGKPYFMLTNESIGRYISHIERYFEGKIIKTGNKISKIVKGVMKEVNESEKIYRLKIGLKTLKY